MNDRSSRISRLLHSQKSRASYIKSKLAVLIPAQIRCLRLRTSSPPLPYQRDLAREADMHQSRISMFETPGAANFTIDTLAKIAAALKVGVIVQFVSFSEMLRWENSFSPDNFDVQPRLEEDHAFLEPPVATVQVADLPSGTTELGSRMESAKLQQLGTGTGPIEANIQEAMQSIPSQAAYAAEPVRHRIGLGGAIT